ncbi:MAG: hypothetical protein KIS61_09360 [Candidatus Eremiobacteraeota bacterium]|nr:hypothetical protein [Candidatus Eremiobacteraeota bacterium]
MTEPESIVTLLRALQRQFADLSALATAKAMEKPDTTFSHHRKLGEAAGLHTAWRTVADLADQVSEGNWLPALADADTPDTSEAGQ